MDIFQKGHTMDFCSRLHSTPHSACLLCRDPKMKEKMQERAVRTLLSARWSAEGGDAKRSKGGLERTMT